MGPLFPRELGRRETRTQLPASSITGVKHPLSSIWQFKTDPQKILGTRANPPTVQREIHRQTGNQIPQYLIQLFTKQRGQK